jgi:hypothetical protein
MCHTETVFVKKAIYINPSGSSGIFYRPGNVIYRLQIVGYVFQDCMLLCIDAVLRTVALIPRENPKF